MIAWAWAALGLAGTFTLAALGDLISEEIRGWLDLVPRAILGLAATWLDPTQRETIYHDEWLPELAYILRGKESRPITRLITGTRYATGLLVAARRVARRLTRTSPSQQANAVIPADIITSMQRMWPSDRAELLEVITKTSFQRGVDLSRLEGWSVLPGEIRLLFPDRGCVVSGRREGPRNGQASNHTTP
jgi:hypothetical protein